MDNKELIEKGYKTIKQLGRELGRELRPNRIPKRFLRNGIKSNGTLYPPEVLEEIKEYLMLEPSKKQELTNLERYGVKSTSQVKEIKEKQVNTLMINYGVKVPAKSKIISEKISKVLLEKNTSTNKTIEERCKLYHDDLVVCSDFQGENKDIIIYCGNCGLVFKRLARFIDKPCPLCSRRKNTTELFKNIARIVHGDKYDYSHVVYKNNKTKIDIFCKKCNKYFSQRPNDHLSGNGHGCIKSKQEEEVNELLTKNNIIFEREKSFDNCRGRKKNVAF